MYVAQEVIEPAAVMEVKVFMQTSKDLTPSAIAECRDKFLIQSTPVPSGWVRRHRTALPCAGGRSLARTCSMAQMHHV